MKSLLMLLALIPAAADAGTILWQDIEIGMTKAEVKQRQPQRIIDLGQGCSGYLTFQYEQKRVAELDINESASDTNSRCAAVIKQSLVAKYGVPRSSKRETVLPDCGNPYAGGLLGALSKLCSSQGGDQPIHYAYVQWTQGGIEITFRDNEADEKSWLIHYRPVVTGSAEAAGKL